MKEIDWKKWADILDSEYCGPGDTGMVMLPADQVVKYVIHNAVYEEEWVKIKTQCIAGKEVEVPINFDDIVAELNSYLFRFPATPEEEKKFKTDELHEISQVISCPIIELPLHVNSFFFCKNNSKIQIKRRVIIR